MSAQEHSSASSPSSGDAVCQQKKLTIVIDPTAFRRLAGFFREMPQHSDPGMAGKYGAIIYNQTHDGPLLVATADTKDAAYALGHAYCEEHGIDDPLVYSSRFRFELE